MYKMHMNQQGVGLDVGQIKFPQIAMEANNIDWSKPIEGQQINPSSIFAALGINGLGYADEGTSIVEREFTALSYIAYWELIKDYYSNKQEGIGAVIHNEGFPKTVDWIHTRTATQITIPQDLHSPIMIATTDIVTGKQIGRAHV